MVTAIVAHKFISAGCWCRQSTRGGLPSVSKLGYSGMFSLNKFSNSQPCVMVMIENAPVKVPTTFWTVNKALAKTHWARLLMIPFPLPSNSARTTAQSTPATFVHA